MTAPERRRPLPALAFIGVLCLLTAIVWFRVIHRSDGSAPPDSSKCPSSAKPSATKTPTHVAAPKVVPLPKRVAVLVLNSTDHNGIALTTKKTLTKQGFRVTEATNDTRAYGGHGLIKGVAEIRYGPRALPAATLLHFYFPHSVMKPTDASSRQVTVSLGQKYKAIASGSAVHKAMRAHHVHFGVPKSDRSKSKSC
jgi:hypothetical protein